MWLSSITVSIPVPTPATAVMIGSAATHAARKTNSRIRKASTMPMTSDGPPAAVSLSNAWPPSAT